MAGNENSGRKHDMTPKELLDNFWEYLAKYGHGFKNEASAGKEVKLSYDRVPTIKEFWCVHLGRSWSNWQEDYLGHKEYSEVCKKIQDYIEAKKVAALLNGEGNTTGLIFDLKNNYGWDKDNIRKHGIDPDSEGITGFKFEIVKTDK